MTVEEMGELFENFEDDHLEFDRIKNPKTSRPDLHAFILLDTLVPGRADMICNAEHDRIWLEVEPEDLAKVATEDDILELVRSGLCFDGDFYMWV